MYSPDISQHSPRLYRLGKAHQIPMTHLADRLIRYALKHLDEVMASPSDDPAPPEVAEDRADYGLRPPGQT